MDEQDLLMPKMVEIETPDLHNAPTKIMIKWSILDKLPIVSDSFTSGEYTRESYDLIIKSTILNQIALIHDSRESDESKYDDYNMMSVLKNMIIINSRDIYRMNFISSIEKELGCLELNYNRYIIHKMLKNIKEKKFLDNLGFRNVINSVSTMPPIDPEIRIAIEKNLPMFRNNRQLKRTLKPFKVDQIIGAKDKENKWWMARVLHAYHPENSHDTWYYVHFEGWGHSHNEWINGLSYRVREFNPRKHFLKRTRAN